MKIDAIAPSLVAPVARAPFSGRADDNGLQRDNELRARFVERASALRDSVQQVSRATAATVRVTNIASVSSSSSLNVNEAPRQVSEGRSVPRTSDSRRPMATVPALRSVRRGEFQVNGYQVDVDPTTDSLVDVLSRIELTAPNTRATFSPVSNKVMIASRSEGGLVMADGAAAFLQAISVLPGRYAAQQSAAIADDAARVAEAAKAAEAAAGSGEQAAAAAQRAQAAERTAAVAARQAESSAAQVQIAEAVAQLQETFNQFASIEDPLVTYDGGGRVTVAASGRTQLDRVVSGAFDRAGLPGGGPASARFDVSPELSFRFDNPQAVMQTDPQKLSAAIVRGDSQVTTFLFGDPEAGSTGLLSDLGDRVGDFLRLARGTGGSTVPVA